MACLFPRCVGGKGRWFTDEEYLEGSAVANIVPGASFLNFTIFAGHRLGGWKFAAIGTFLILAPGAIAMLILSAWYASGVARFPIVTDALRGLAAAAAGLVIITPIRLLKSQTYSVQNLLIAAGTFVGIGVFRLPMLAVVLPMIVVAVWVNRPLPEKAA